MTVRTTIGCTSLKLFWNPHRIKSTYSLQLSRYGVHDPVPWVHYWTDSSAYYYDLWSFAYVTFLVLGLWFQCCFPVPHHACTVPAVSSSCLTFPNHTSLYLSFWSLCPIVMSVEEICFKFSKTVHLVSRLNCIELLLLGTDQWSKLLTPHIFKVRVL